MEEHGVTQTEHMATIEAHAVAQQVQQVHVATYTEHSMLSADEDSPSSPEDTSYDDSDILNSTAADEVTAHLAAAGKAAGCSASFSWHTVHTDVTSCAWGCPSGPFAPLGCCEYFLLASVLVGL